jgi:hypothetical protein
MLQQPTREMHADKTGSARDQDNHSISNSCQQTACRRRATVRLPTQALRINMVAMVLWALIYIVLGAAGTRRRFRVIDWYQPAKQNAVQFCIERHRTQRVDC